MTPEKTAPIFLIDADPKRLRIHVHNGFFEDINHGTYAYLLSKLDFDIDEHLDGGIPPSIDDLLRVNGLTETMISSCSWARWRFKHSSIGKRNYIGFRLKLGDDNDPFMMQMDWGVNNREVIPTKTYFSKGKAIYSINSAAHEVATRDGSSLVFNLRKEGSTRHGEPITYRDIRLIVENGDGYSARLEGEIGGNLKLIREKSWRFIF